VAATIFIVTVLIIQGLAENPLSYGMGKLKVFARKTAIWSRVTEWVGLYLSGAESLVIPSAANCSIQGA
jgi:hypothetical protein